MDRYSKIPTRRWESLFSAPITLTHKIVEPAADDSPISKFLQNRGGGLHHCCYEVENPKEQISAMRREGALLAKPPKPAVAFSGRLIAWLLTSEKLLVELLEKGAEI